MLCLPSHASLCVCICDEGRTTLRAGHLEALCGGFGPPFDLVPDLLFFRVSEIQIWQLRSQTNNCEAAPCIMRVQITDMLFVGTGTSFFTNSLPPSHRNAGFHENHVSIHKLFFLPLIRGVADLFGKTTHH